MAAAGGAAPPGTPRRAALLLFIPRLWVCYSQPQCCDTRPGGALWPRPPRASSWPGTAYGRAPRGLRHGFARPPRASARGPSRFAFGLRPPRPPLRGGLRCPPAGYARPPPVALRRTPSARSPRVLGRLRASAHRVPRYARPGAPRRRARAGGPRPPRSLRCPRAGAARHPPLQSSGPVAPRLACSSGAPPGPRRPSLRRPPPLGRRPSGGSRPCRPSAPSRPPPPGRLSRERGGSRPYGPSAPPRSGSASAAAVGGAAPPPSGLPAAPPCAGRRPNRPPPRCGRARDPRPAAGRRDRGLGGRACAGTRPEPVELAHRRPGA